MKQLSAFSILKTTTTLMVIGAIFFSCKDSTGTHEVVSESCVDTKDYSGEYAKDLNGIRHYISVDEGVKLTQNFSRNKASILSGKYKDDTAFLADYETFNLKAIDSLLCQQQAIGFRIYSGLDENNKMRFVIVGVDNDGKDILQQNSEGKSGAFLKQPLSGTAKAAGASGKELVLESGQRHP